jgi:hypothetical protein
MQLDAPEHGNGLLLEFLPGSGKRHCPRPLVRNSGDAVANRSARQSGAIARALAD